MPSDGQDLAGLYDAHARKVWRTLLRLGVPPSFVEDAVQDVFLAAQRRLAAFRGDSAPGTWLVGIAVRVAANARRLTARRGPLMPVDEALARVRARVVAQAATASRAAEPRKPPVRGVPLSQELLAAAAVVIVLLGARAVVLALRSDAAPEGRGPQAQAVIDAYTAGDLTGAQRLASQHCNERMCAPLASALARAVGLAPRVDTLSADELDELARLDATLADGHQTALARAIAQRRDGLSTVSAPPATAVAAPTADASKLLEEARQLMKERQYEQAVEKLTQCVRAAPGFAPCYLVLGSTWSRVAARDSDAKAMHEARVAYERFLELAPPDDEYVPRVRAILDAADQPSPVNALPAQLEDFFLASAEQARAQGDWLLVGRVAREILRRDSSNARALELLAEVRREAIDLYLKGYQLKDSDPQAAIRAFAQVAELLPENDEYSLKARARLVELAAP